MSEEEVDDREFVPNEVLASRALLCPSCGYAPSAVHGVAESTRPKFEDRTICWACGSWGIYTRTPLGAWSMRKPTAQESTEMRRNPEVRKARDQWKAAKLHGLGPSHFGHFAGGAEPPPASSPFVVVPAEPVSWDDMRKRHGFARGAMHRLQDWAAANVADRRFGPGSVELDCGACATRVRLGPAGQQAIFQMRANVLCPACVLLAQKVIEERDGS